MATSITPYVGGTREREHASYDDVYIHRGGSKHSIAAYLNEVASRSYRQNSTKRRKGHRQKANHQINVDRSISFQHRILQI
jgi:hypothetical protein